MDNEALAAAERLAGARLEQVVRVGGGGNNRLFRVAAGGATYALKHYPLTPGDDRDRLGTEFGALRFLELAGVAAVPRAIAADPGARCALYEWIDGPAPPADRQAIAAMVALLERLHAARTAAGAGSLPRASEAVAAWDELAAQVDERLMRLGALAENEPALAGFLAADLQPLWETLRHPDGLRAGADALTLSPSDFGTHNMLRRPDGRDAFVDFEYFGWDDPVKLVCDVLWHPAMELRGGLVDQFLAGVADIYRDDASFRERLHARFPLFGLRWALIVLNEYLPASWARRRSAGDPGDWGVAKARQLERARALVSRAYAVHNGAAWTA